ncbi:MAG TPA: energy transducer TonB [Gemmatimonadaceae bacterium]
MMRLVWRARCLVTVTPLVILATCTRPDATSDGLQLPALLTTDLPFRYPPDLFTAGIEGSVALHLFVDSSGLVVPDSTRVVEASTHAAFDSSAVAGAPYLEFRPAQRGSSRLGHAVVLPVQFRVPRADTAQKDTTEP